MKFEEYHQRLIAEKGMTEECSISPSFKFIRRDFASASQRIDILDKRVARAEVAFYRQHWWQFWRPRPPNI